ncbi:aspartyl-phosphate phosphatase Spo0E family protein [Caldibacillus thermolactis]|uniref:Aspartyl-phosphate phosphatase Spo0E family protein n=1 Tax=Pallidibacillus thermolactis TaxID=251051 RepID=A0ABT2WGR9_9BACI|nr:aspartyl-phosphate phosphatase Spo0E family protein [Pallidibacillus thermolactis]MCU9594892.1 aspartyl-phosphate phosphatase Spo0E family protein [Pallidibacillus thermolactis]MCU9599624.1 aspartyl-phosphate phosphatase Spo0E family protein [Pallidibacillus thermolactis subsp. kokeshiiformis]MED1675075.1 aspartyl-phosphate phosphatase Spo0E family protein [Pallidibacillus thermolactis subsp. kokeshiiformis]
MLNAKLSLIFEIEKKRKEMFECARQKGMHSLECVQKSQELDRLILQVQRQKMKFE